MYVHVHVYKPLIKDLVIESHTLAHAHDKVL